jgi:hypothetical protein
VWVGARKEWVSCPPEEITWLDRNLVSGNSDLTLHRAPRCAGLRYVHHRWEVFSRDPTYQVYLAPYSGGPPLDARGVQAAAQRVLPVAPSQHYETLPLVLEPGAWLVSVGNWVLPLRLDAPPQQTTEPAAPAGDEQLATQEKRVPGDGALAKRGSPPRPDAAERVRGYFARNAVARMSMAFHYQEFILGLPAPQTVPMIDVVIALDLSGEGAVSDYKKLLQGLIWKERGHARDLADFLLANGLLTPADLDEARRAAAENERKGVCEIARQRLQYRPKGR